MNFKQIILDGAKQNGIKTIVFPEAGFSDRILSAAIKIKKLKIANVILVVDATVSIRDKRFENFNIINPKTSDLTLQFAETLYNLRKHKGLSLENAKTLLLNPFYFGCMLMHAGLADGMVGGAEVSTPECLRPALQILKAQDDDIISTFTILSGKNKHAKMPLFLTDCGLNINPSDLQLSIFAERVANEYAKLIKQEASVAFLSYSTFGSAGGEIPEKMKSACDMFKKGNPNIYANGDIQLDAALVEKIANIKMPNKKFVASNVLVFPDLASGNITYKAIENFGKMQAIGPIVQGLSKPVNDLSRGCSVEDIILVTAITVLQCK